MESNDDLEKELEKALKTPEEEITEALPEEEPIVYQKSALEVIMENIPKEVFLSIGNVMDAYAESQKKDAEHKLEQIRIQEKELAFREKELLLEEKKLEINKISLEVTERDRADERQFLARFDSRSKYYSLAVLGIVFSFLGTLLYFQVVDKDVVMVFVAIITTAVGIAGKDFLSTWIAGHSKSKENKE